MIKFDIKSDDKILTDEVILEGYKNVGPLGARETFVEETHFQSKAYQDKFYEDYVRSFSLSGQHYGRMNRNFLSLSPRESMLNSVAGSSVRVLNFVADAYNSFVLDLEMQKQKKAIPQSSPFYNFEAVNGFDNLQDKYYEYVSRDYDLFLNFLSRENLHKEIKDFKSFLKVYTKFVDVRTPSAIINKSSYVVSNSCSKKISGLFIDLAEDSILDNKNKFDKYINASGFKCFAETAKYAGFIINKDKPWQIVADLTSPRMKYFFKLRMDRFVQQGILSENPIACSSSVYEECKVVLENFDLQGFLFEQNNIRFYDIVNEDDVNSLKRLMGRIYNSYVTYRPTIKENEIIRVNNELLVKEKTITRKGVNIQLLLNEKINYDWTRLYIFTKAREANVGWSQSRFDIAVDKAWEMIKSLDIAAAMRYVQSEINTVKISNIKQRNFQF